MLLEKDVLKICCKFAGEHPCRYVVSIKLPTMSNGSTLPLTFSFETTNRLSNVNSRLEKISKISQTLGQNKIHGQDEITVRMIKMYRWSKIKPLRSLFNNCVKQGVLCNILCNIYKFLEKDCLLNSDQSGFRPIDSSIHQFIAIALDIFTTFNTNPSLVARGAFLNLSKAFDRVWHKRPL